ncbi:DUF5916 domain-containing protein [Reichenbachiella sp. MALMAid0571]|uniref:DUF5916 domain-containing protein n=1 Tax=Reichenbachiella sp. MALMAid0571 TaxID=3143939 RepID=UPI0032DF0019
MKVSAFTFSIVFLFNCHLLFAQTDQINREKYKLFIYETQATIEVDGILDEEPWLNAQRASDFFRVLPIDTGFAVSKTEVMMTYDETHLYMGIICYDVTPGRRPVESLRRDFTFGKNDNFLSFIDTYNDQTNGFSFGISAAGAQWDGTQSSGGTVGLDWDTKWKSEVKNYPDKWVAEFAIPFRSIRYREGDTEWGISFSRLDLKNNEKSSWTPIPRQFPTASLAYTGTLVWDKPLGKAGTRFGLIPYISGRVLQDVETGEPANTKGDAGLDAKISLSTSMNLDLTVNPDFSQVEVDRQVTNLSRFELFFPEKRQFFLENSDIFASLGTYGLRPFFSRRIGLQNKVRAGARVSGKLGEKWRIGLMNMQTGSSDIEFGANYSVATVQKQVFSRSNLNLFVVNKELTTNYNEQDTILAKYNRVAGIDFNLASADNQWTGKMFYHQSFSPQAIDKHFTTFGELNYKTQQFNLSGRYTYVGDGYDAEVGYVIRKNYHRINPEIGYKFYPGSNRIANHGFNFSVNNFYKPDFTLTDRALQLKYAIVWLNRSELSLELTDGFVRLLTPFDPTNNGGEKLDTGSTYNWKEFTLTYTSDARQLFNYIVSVRSGGYFDGNRFSLNGETNYRVQPFGSLALVSSFHRITNLSTQLSDTEFFLIGPKLDITFTNKIFFTTFVQYNDQIDNLNLNMRFQWRFAPVSDLFIVYTDNSFPENFQTKNRALVLKLSYWFN